MASHQSNRNALYLGGLFIVLGILFLLNNARIIRFDFIFENFWALLLIGVGALIIYKSSKKGADTVHTVVGDRSESSRDDYVTSSNTFGDLKLSLDSQSFKGGKLQVTFGELHVNLAKIQLDEGQNVLHLNVTFGEIAVTLPADMPVRITASNVGGDIKLFDQKWDGLNRRASWQSSSYDSSDRKLDIVCNIVFGDIKAW